MMNYKNNQTVKFVLPLITKLPSNYILRDNFIGAFIGDVDRPEYDGKILLVYKLPTDRSDLKFELKMVQHPEYYTSYDYDNARLVIYVFNIPEQSIDSVENILDGKYSKILLEDKLERIKFWEVVLNKNNSKNPILKSILFPEEEELWFIPDFKDELFDIHNM
jgi:hypothetical protein